ncbi:MAG: nucleotidyltransferase domain-containing protein [Nitrospirota bacterium]
MIDEQILSKIVERLVVRFQPHKIILFGSQARGTADNRSDVDILVVCHISGKEEEKL